MPQDLLDPPTEAVVLPPRKFVRVLEQRTNGLVRFEFAVGWPDLSCELVLPRAIFDEFCSHHGVEFLEGEAPGADFPIGGREE